MADGLFVTGTDTGVGKTVVTAALTAHLRAAGYDVRAFKPAVSGVAEPEVPGWPHDHVLLAQCSDNSVDNTCPTLFGPAVSPHLAAGLAGVKLSPERFLAELKQAGDRCQRLIVEGVGGWLVPLTDSYLVADYARDLKLPVVIVARPGLGTINHTLLTLNSVRSYGLEVKAVIFNPWPSEPGYLLESNLQTVARLGDVPTCYLPTVATSATEELAEAASALPALQWLDLPTGA